MVEWKTIVDRKRLGLKSCLKMNVDKLKPTRTNKRDGLKVILRISKIGWSGISLMAK
jgi:hypothetical protein